MTGQPGNKTIYEYEDVTYLATIVNTFDDNTKATLSLLGTELILR